MIGTGRIGRSPTRRSRRSKESLIVDALRLQRSCQPAVPAESGLRLGNCGPSSEFLVTSPGRPVTKSGSAAGAGPDLRRCRGGGLGRRPRDRPDAPRRRARRAARSGASRRAASCAGAPTSRAASRTSTRIRRAPGAPRRLRGRAGRRAGARRSASRPRFVQNDWSTLVPSLERGNVRRRAQRARGDAGRARRASRFTRPYYVFAERLVRAARTTRACAISRRCAGCASARSPASQAWDLLRAAGAIAGPLRRASTSRSPISSTGAPTPCCSTTSSSIATRRGTRRWSRRRRRRRGTLRDRRCGPPTTICARRSTARSTRSSPAAPGGEPCAAGEIDDDRQQRLASMGGLADRRPAPSPPRAASPRARLDRQPAPALPGGRAGRRC